jgi:hypothetical protein
MNNWLVVLKAKGIKATKVVIHDEVVVVHFKHGTEYILREYNGKYVLLNKLFKIYINESIPFGGEVLWWLNPTEGYLEGVQLK